MLFVTNLNSLSPDEIERLKVWCAAHCVPGRRCDECGGVFGNPFRYERIVRSNLADNAFLLYATCEDCAERVVFPNCEADAQKIRDRVVMMMLDRSVESKKETVN